MKGNKNKFAIKDLLHMSQRENNAIQIDELHDKRDHAFKNESTNIYYYQNSLSSFKYNYQQRQSTIVNSMFSQNKEFGFQTDYFFEM
jgi:hypothetical protein